MHVVPIFVCHSSLLYILCPFFLQHTQLARAGLSRSKDDLERLADSVDIYHVNGQVFIHSTIDGIAKPKIVPTGDQARCADDNLPTAVQ